MHHHACAFTALETYLLACGCWLNSFMAIIIAYFTELCVYIGFVVCMCLANIIVGSGSIGLFSRFCMFTENI